LDKKLHLKQKAISGVKWTTLSTIITAITQLLQISILARYLEPSAFGLIAIIMVVIGFSQMFVDFGVSSAIIHKQNVTTEQLSTLYWLNILSSIVVFMVIMGLSPFIASFYHEAVLTQLIILTSTTIVIQSFGKQFFVLFEKELQFNTVAKIDIVAAFSSLALAVTLTINGFGVYSLIYPLILSMSVKSFLLIFNGLKYHKPKLYFNISEVKEFIIFGMYQMGSGIVNYFNSQFDVIIIGKIFGSETLGLYSMAKQLVMRPAQIINPVVTRVTFPTMSKVQNDTQRLKEIYLKTINLLSSVNFPIYIAMIILAPEIITIFLGTKWLAATTVFQILSIYALFRSIGNPIGSLVLAKGKPHYEMYWNIGLFFIIPATIYIGSFYGIEGVSWSLVILILILMIPNWYFLVRRLCGARFLEYHLQIVKPLLLSVVAGIIAFSIFEKIKTNIVILDIVLISVIGFILIIALNMKFNKEFISMLKREKND
jgi:O-antigen/teichoic acid export membrane protein